MNVTPNPGDARSRNGRGNAVVFGIGDAALERALVLQQLFLGLPNRIRILHNQLAHFLVDLIRAAHRQRRQVRHVRQQVEGDDQAGAEQQAQRQIAVRVLRLGSGEGDVVPGVSGEQRADHRPCRDHQHDQPVGPANPPLDLVKTVRIGHSLPQVREVRLDGLLVARDRQAEDNQGQKGSVWRW